MTSLSRPDLAASPAIAIEAQKSCQQSLPDASTTPQRAPWASFEAGVGQPPTSLPLAAGRKRSRDVVYANVDLEDHLSHNDKDCGGWAVDDDNTSLMSANPIVTPFSDVESRFDSGPVRGHSEDEKVQLRCRAEQGDGRIRKAQRVESCADRSSRRHDAFATVCGLRHVNNSAASADLSLVVDDCTLHLGIGWRRIGDGEDMQAAARGWARFIERNFALTGVRICLESRGLQSYLVEADEGFFLFDENLRCGRLVSRSVEGVLGNLKLSPPVFDGPELRLDHDENRRLCGALVDTFMKID